MKRIVIALALIIGIVGVCVAERFVLHRQGEEINRLVQQAAEACQAGEREQATKAAARLEELWHSAEKKLSVFVGNDDIRELELSITRLEPLSRAGNTDVFLSECALIKMLLQHIVENQQLRLTNIL